MDSKEQETQDLLVEAQIRQGWSLVPLPPTIHAELTAAHEVDPTIPVWPAVRFQKLTHKVRRDIAAAAARLYNVDLQDGSLLSNKQLLELTRARGEWTLEEEHRLNELQLITSRLMQELTMPRGQDQSVWTDRMSALQKRIRLLLEEQVPAAVPLLDRWASFTPNLLGQYTLLFAGEQGREVYSHEADFQQLMEQVPLELVDDLQELDEYTDRLQKFLDLARLREEHTALAVKQNKIFGESIENRRENAEAMLRLEHIASWATLDGKPQGPIRTPDELPERVLEWLLIECQFFMQGIPPETREYLQQWGFLPAPSVPGSSASSDASPAEPLSNSGSAVSATTAAGSMG